MSGLRIVDLRAIANAEEGTIVPAQSRHAFNDAQSLLSTANGICQQAETDALVAHELARKEGFETGLQEGQAEMARELTRLHAQAHSTLQGIEGSVSDLAVAIVQRLTPQLDVADIVAPMVARAIAAAQAEQYLLVKVHPEVEAAATRELERLTRAHPSVSVADVVADAGLGKLSCVIESEAGRVRGDWTTQLEAIRQALLEVDAQTHSVNHPDEAPACSAPEQPR